mmetsp:Transcript_23959/g.34328  ORF Transcript_23959/g.34328 Transcript_23959/m.34328 type:complete len:460 (+) Transcript_23959:338-1717(+)
MAILRATRSNVSGSMDTASEYKKWIENGEAVSFEDIPVLPEEPPFLTMNEHKDILLSGLDDEHQLIVHLTLKLVDLCGKAKVNSEEEKWLHTSISVAENYEKPDGSSSWIPVFKQGREHRVTQLGNLRRRLVGQQPFEQIFSFGCPIWELRDLYTIWEFKLQMTPADRGVAYNYLGNLSRNDHFNTYYVILADSYQFYIFSARDGVISSVAKIGNWTTPGSKAALLRVLRHKNAGLTLLEGLCEKLNVEVVGYLGMGGMGRCFEVRDKISGGSLALKTVLTCHRIHSMERAQTEALVGSEYYKLLSLIDVPNVVKVVPHSLTRIYNKDNLQQGLGYLMQNVGESVKGVGAISSVILHKLFHSLAGIHALGHYHGDSRVHNAILVDGEVVWIDFMLCLHEPVEENANRKKREDIAMLIGSIFNGNIHKTDRNLVALLAEYEARLANIAAILDYVTPFTQF